MGKLKIEGNGGNSGKYLGFNIPDNTLMASFNDNLEIWSAPSTQENIGFGHGEDKNHTIHKILILFPLNDSLADNFKKHMQKIGKIKFTPIDLVNFMITFLEFSSQFIMGLGMTPEYVRDTLS